MNKKLTVLGRNIVNDIRISLDDSCMVFPPTKGVIFGYFVAKSEYAYKLMGLPKNTGSYNNDNPFIEAIIPGGPKNSETECYVAQACAVTEGTCRAMKGEYGRLSSDLPDDKVPKGASNEKGGVCFDIVCNNNGGTNKKFGAFEVCFDDTRKLAVMRIYVTVKIQGSETDCEFYARRAKPAIEKFVKRKSGLYVLAPA